MIADEELARLKAPLASLPGLDPVGLTVWDAEYNRHALALNVDGHILTMDVAYAPNVFASEATVDLADASTADRVARWVAGRVGLEVGSTAPRWDGPGPLTDFWSLESTHFRPVGSSWIWEVPTLFCLDPTDDRRLPDGSRFVDRLALALVAVHLGGAP